MREEENRRNQCWIWAWQYRNSGFYYEQVKAYLDNFSNVKVIIYEDLKNQEHLVLNGICEFIGVSTGFNFDTSYKYNVSGDPKNAVLYTLETSRGLVKFVKKIVPKSLVTKIKKNWTGERQMVKTGMDIQTRCELIEFFRRDILKLQDLLKADLSHWLK
jgi:hypothetical protein